MKDKTNTTENHSALTAEPGATPTIFQYVTDIQFELTKLAGLPVNPFPAPSKSQMPGWSSKILKQFTKTILKPVLKLKPSGVMNWRNYGKMIGIIERCKIFLKHDVPRIFREEGFDEITDNQWETLLPEFGEDQLRQHLIALLSRSVAAEESLEGLLSELLERQFEYWDKMKAAVLFHLSQQDAKTNAVFFKGMAEGFVCFLDESGCYVGDRGRTNICFDFLAHRLEIEKYRRTMPIKSRRDLQSWIINKAKIAISKDEEWFDHFCDEICLSVKGVGWKPKPQIL